MSLLLCRKRAETPYFFDKMNINIWADEELSYVIYNYPLLCMGDFLSERLFVWIDKALDSKVLADTLKTAFARGDSKSSLLLEILKACNYYTRSEIMDFGTRLKELQKLSEWELDYLEGRALFKVGIYKQAFKKIEEAVKKQELEYRKLRPDDHNLRIHNKKKADMFCDMASCRMQLFDEAGALELIRLSEETFSNERAVRMRFFIEKKADLKEDVKAELENTLSRTVEDVRESDEYKNMQEFFKSEESVLFPAARKLVSKWKKEYRRM